MLLKPYVHIIFNTLKPPPPPPQKKKKKKKKKKNARRPANDIFKKSFSGMKIVMACLFQISLKWVPIPSVQLTLSQHADANMLYSATMSEDGQALNQCTGVMLQI